MYGSQEEYQSLLKLLSNVTSCDPEVQAGNVVQLQELSEWPSAPYALLDVMIHESCSVSIRQAAGITFRQLQQKASPNFTRLLNVDSVTPFLIRALADPIPVIRTGASLIAVELFPNFWPTLPQALLECTMVFCQDKTHHDNSQRFLGVVTCTRILCEERSSALRRLVTSTEACCSAFNELLCTLVRIAAEAVTKHDTNALSFVQTVMHTVSTSFTADILSAREVINEEVFSNMDDSDDKGSDIPLSDNDSSNPACLPCEMPSYVFSYVTQLNSACCALIVSVMQTFSFDTDDSLTLLLSLISYISATLQWGTFWNDATETAVDSLFPTILRLIESAQDGLVDERVTVQCLDFLADLAQSVVGGAALLSRKGDNVTNAFFRCALLPRTVIDSASVECAASGTADAHTFVASNTDEACDAATSVRRALTWTLSSMNLSCTDALLTHLIPRIAIVLAPNYEAHLDGVDSVAAVEAALFLLVVIVEELFDALSGDFVAHVVQMSGATLASGPVLLRYQSVRCISRIAGIYAESKEKERRMAVPAALHILIRPIDDSNAHVQVEGIRAVTSVLAAWISSYQNAAHDTEMNDGNCDNHTAGVNESGACGDDLKGAALYVDVECVSAVIDCLLTALPSMQLSSRTAAYRCLSRVLPLHDDSELLHRATTRLLAVAESFTESICSNSECTEALGLDFVSLLNAMSDMLTTNAMVAQKCTLPLSVICAAFTGYYVEVLSTASLPPSDKISLPSSSTVHSSLLRVYGDDICMLLFDLLDICCDATLSEEDAVCNHSTNVDRTHLLCIALLTRHESASDHIVSLCLRLLELRSEDAKEMRRAGFALLSSALRCHVDVNVLQRLYRLCNNEIFGDAASNAFLCLSIMFYSLAFDEDDASRAVALLFHTSVPAAELSALGSELRRRLAARAQEKHIRTNAFGCAVALAALQPMVFDVAAHTMLVKRAATFLQKMEVTEKFRTIKAISVLLSHGSSISIPADLRKCVLAFVASAPPVMSNDVQKRLAQQLAT